ncbi:MAG: hypothetical protein IPL11_13485 [Candidatus Accumulibacter sp.]|nr:hypothetical protein [Accumulibacter sp.]
MRGRQGTGHSGRQAEGSTHQRLEAPVRDKVNKKMAATIAESFDFLVLISLRGQVEAVREGRKPDNYIQIERLNMMELGRLQIALKGVENSRSSSRATSTCICSDSDAFPICARAVTTRQCQAGTRGVAVSLLAPSPAQTDRFPNHHPFSRLASAHAPVSVGHRTDGS